MLLDPSKVCDRNEKSLVSLEHNNGYQLVMGHVLIYFITAYRDKGNGALNNRSRDADDGLRQDRHPDRTRGT